MSSLGKQVCETILQRIQSGELKVGDRLPPEVDLAVDLGVSRSTVRLAFSELEKGGVLRRRKKAGTQIIAAKPQKRFSMTTQGMHELLDLGRDTQLEISAVTHVQTKAVDALHAHGLPESRWLKVSGSRTLPGDAYPFSINQVYVPEAFDKIMPKLNAPITSVFQLIEATYDISVARVSQTTRAVVCPAEEQQLMGLVQQSPALRIDAVLHTAAEHLMEVSVATFDPERFQIKTDVTVD